jgi:hypothetical protein
MNKPLSDSILEFSGGRPTLVFVSFRFVSFRRGGRRTSPPGARLRTGRARRRPSTAGPLPEDLGRVERLFRSGNQRLLVSGVVKGTEHFEPTSRTQPQMTDRSSTRRDSCFIQTFINSLFPVESSLLPNIEDHVNAEICAGRVRTKKDLLE